MTMKIKAILAALLVVVLFSCGDDKSPEAVTKNFVKAWAKMDYDAAKQYCTKVSAPALDAMNLAKLFQKEAKLTKEEVTCTIDGDKAKCKFCCAEGYDNLEYSLVKEDGEWKIEFLGGGVNNAIENIGEGLETIIEAKDTLTNLLDQANKALDSLNVK